ncbi:MAG: glycoside hydrolase family 127 protein [Bacteroidales bacterium]|nr:glycoside hydrolase family 127 protein [Bacteroidales bacterium]
MNKICSALAIFALIALACCNNQSRDTLYPNEFPLKDVVLLEGPFRDARDLNIVTLLKYDVDRLLAPFLKEAGLPAKASSYPNWEGLDGHVGGHYLSAMAMNYAATGNAECKRRMDYMISELRACQDANGTNYPDWGEGYAGGMPNSKVIWSTLQKGDFKAYRSAWVPWYNVHKIYAGLRDAWSYAGSENARIIFLKFCDWGTGITSALTDVQMESMLNAEHGGINEIFADAYQMTGDEKYLTAAKRFSHRMLLDAMSAGIDNLDNKHANTQIPKAAGFQRIAELSHDKKYFEAARFFWETVTENRSLAFGGNSRREHFPDSASCIDFVNEIQGPESCNTYNMLRLTEHLFRTDPSARYADYYEGALYNHILSTRHPEHGGYVYFTPARPRHYRVYSAPNEAMWCCVGTGMENHGKYNQFIYTHINDSLYLNLFIASELDWKEKGVKIRQETKFPNEEQTSLMITKGSSRFSIMVRYPSWVMEGALKIMVNGKPISFVNQPSSYIALTRRWKKGDVVQVYLPMHTSIEQMPNVPDYIAFLHGPVLLGAKTGTEDLKGLIADDSRWGQFAAGEKLPVDEAPVIIGDDKSKAADALMPVKDKPLTFTAPALKLINPAEIVFEPFFSIHDTRYMIYWRIVTEEQLKSGAGLLN